MTRTASGQGTPTGDDTTDSTRGRRRPGTLALAAIACAGCCAAPLLAGLVGAAVGIAGRWWAGLATAGVTVAALAALRLSRTRRRRGVPVALTAKAADTRTGRHRRAP